MICPNCDYPQTACSDSRPRDAGSVIRRRRVCTKCGYRFTTFEECREMSTTEIIANLRKIQDTLNQMEQAILSKW